VGERTGLLAAIVSIWMFVTILPISSLLRSLELVEATMSFMSFTAQLRYLPFFVAIPSMIVPVIAVVIPPLVPHSGILTAVVPKIASGLIWPGGMIGSIVVAFVGGALGLDYALAEKGLIQFYLTQDYATVGILTLCRREPQPPVPSGFELFLDALEGARLP
jgi:hypothetical protein